MPLISHQTAEQLRQLIAQKRTVSGKPVGGVARPRAVAFVRCTSTTAAASTSVGAQCYPGVIVDVQSDQTVQPTLGTVWLTLLTTGDAVGRPGSGNVYECLLAGNVEAATGDIRPRAFAAVTDSTPSLSLSNSGSSSLSGGGVDIVSDVVCDAGGLRVTHKTLTGYVTIGGSQYPITLNLT